MSTTTSTTTTSTTAPEERKETTTTGKTTTTTTTTTTGTTGTAAGTGTGTGTGTAAGTEQGREKHQYPYKKLGDLLDEVDDLLTHRREELQQKATEKVHDLLKQLNQLYIEIKGMVSKEPVDPAALADKQERLNQLENQAVQGVYGAEAKICPLDQEGQPIHHVRIEAIPPGQATVRHLIEKCHQMITRVLDRLDEMANKLVEAPAGTTSATSTTSVKIGGQEQAKISAQKEPTEVTVTKGTSESGTRGKEEEEKPPHIARGAATAEGTSAPITSQGPGAGISAH